VAGDSTGSIARLLVGRALAFEGLSQWKDALADYNAALDMTMKEG
jgi:hypothetical protein